MEFNGGYKVVPCEEGDVEYIEQALRLSDDAHARPQKGVKAQRLVLKVTDPNGMAVAGCVMDVDTWGVASVGTLWVDKPYRRHRVGTRLLLEAEMAARERGCYLVLAGTFDWQPYDFWEDNGYDLFNIWADYPEGHDNLSFSKALKSKVEADLPSIEPLVLSFGEEEDADYFEDRLYDYNHAHVPYLHANQSFELKITDEEDNLIAGCVAGNTVWDVAFVEMLWVAERYRGQGMGAALLQEAERLVRDNGAYMVLACAFDWQVEYFSDNGYELTGSLKNCPKRHTYYSLSKRF